MTTKKHKVKKYNKVDLVSLDILKASILKSDTGLLFCFGTSFISRVIQAKTKLYDEEQVPSHVAMIVNGQFLYESTSAPEKLGNKRIPSGVSLRFATQRQKYYFLKVITLRLPS